MHCQKGLKKKQTLVVKILHRKLKIEATQTHKKTRVTSILKRKFSIISKASKYGIIDL